MSQANLKTNDLYSSSDLGLVTAVSLFYPIEAIDRQNPQKAIFFFKRDDGLDRIVEAFWRGELKESLLAYFNQLKAIKSRLYGER